MPALTQIEPGCDANAPARTDEPVLLYRPPASWKTSHTARKFIRLSDRHYSYETDLDMLRRSVDWLVERQDARGSFHTDDEYRQGDRIDDQLGAAGMLAFLLKQTGINQKLVDALERGVRFHLDHLVRRSSAHAYPYSRAYLDYDSAYDVGNNVWVLWGGALVLKYGQAYLSKSTAHELRELMEQTWKLISTSSIRGENPCHNQLLAFCEIGILYARSVGNEEIVREMLAYYHQRLRKLRIFDRGHWIYSEFNQWDANYGLLSWMSLEHLFAATGDPAFAEDADEMALYFNEMVSAGGYYWGGSRYNEGGVEEFVHLPASRACELGLERLLLPTPADQWHRLVLDGHYGRVLVLRMGTPVRTPNAARALSPTPWSFRTEHVSVCLRNDVKMHHISAGGLEIVPVASTSGDGDGFTWLQNGIWKRDYLLIHPPPPSEGQPFTHSEPLQKRGVLGVAAFQRGYDWETRQWWIGSGQNLLWIGQIYSHSSAICDKIDFILGNPVLTQLEGEPVPVTEVETAEGLKAHTQGDAVIVASDKFLRFGDVYMGATAPLRFVRPSKEAFHTFPLPKKIYLRDCASSNEIRVNLSEARTEIACRQSLFFAVQLGRSQPNLISKEGSASWEVESEGGSFRANLSNGIWHYSFKTSAGEEEDLPQNGFGFNPEVR